MKLFDYTKPKIIVADKGKKIRDKNDIYTSEVKDEQGNVITPEHIPYYSTLIFLGSQIETLEQCKELYIEEEE